MSGLWRAVGLGLAVGAIQSAHFVTVYVVDVGHASAIAFVVLASTSCCGPLPASARLSAAAC